MAIGWLVPPGPSLVKVCLLLSGGARGFYLFLHGASLRSFWSWSAVSALLSRSRSVPCGVLSQAADAGDQPQRSTCNFLLLRTALKGVLEKRLTVWQLHDGWFFRGAGVDDAGHVWNDMMFVFHQCREVSRWVHSFACEPSDRWCQVAWLRRFT